MGNLTQQIVERAAPPTTGQKFIRDAKVSGLALRITARGAKAFVWEGRCGTAKYRRTLGAYPAQLLDAARKDALEINSAIASGRDPFAENQTAREVADAELTFGDLEREFFERHATPMRKAAGTIRNYRNDLRNHVPADWRGRKLSTFTRGEIARLHHAVGKAGTKRVNERERNSGGSYAANRTVALLRVMFNLAIRWGFLSGSNPAQRVDFFPEHGRKRYFHAGELRRLSDSLAQEPEHWRAYFALTLMLGTRKNELLSARWEHVNLEAGTLTLPETKSGEPHTLPLIAPVAAILQSLPRGTSVWIFPSLRPTRTRVGYMTGAQQAWKRIRERAGITDKNAVIHTLRHTTASWLAGAGNSAPIVQKALNHSQMRTTEGYMHLDLNPVRDALERSAARMDFLPARVAAPTEDVYSDMVSMLATPVIEIAPAKAA
jgi:integrase